MRVDVTVTFWDKDTTFPYTALSLIANNDAVNSVIVAVDGPIPDALSRLADIPKWKIVGFPTHDGCGISRVHNLAVEYVTTPFFIHLDADTVVASGALSAMTVLAHPGRLTFGRAHEVPHLPFPAELKPIRSADSIPVRLAIPKWAHFKTFSTGCFWMADTAAYRAIGGWNEAMTEYGGQDFEFAVRWGLYNGPTSVHRAGIYAYAALPFDHTTRPDTVPDINHAVVRITRDMFYTKYEDYLDRIQERVCA